MKIEIDLDFSKLSGLARKATSSKENIIITASILFVIIGCYRLLFL